MMLSSPYLSYLLSQAAEIEEKVGKGHRFEQAHEECSSAIKQLQDFMEILYISPATPGGEARNSSGLPEVFLFGF